MEYSPVSKATGYGLDDPISISSKKRNLSFPHSFQIYSIPNISSYPVGTGNDIT